MGAQVGNLHFDMYEDLISLSLVVGGFSGPSPGPRTPVGDSIMTGVSCKANELWILDEQLLWYIGCARYCPL